MHRNASASQDRQGISAATARPTYSTDGFIVGADKKTIFLNVDSASHLQFIIGHEVSHVLELNNVKAYHQQLVAILPYLAKGKIAESEEGLKTNPVHKAIVTFVTKKSWNFWVILNTESI